MMNDGSADLSVRLRLTADHTRLDQIFDDACDLVGAGNCDAARGAFKQFAQGLAHHIAVEEGFLFPAFDAHAHMPGPTTVMRDEHRAIERLLALASASLGAGDAGQFATEAAELAAVLKAHNLKEERVLYPRSDASLDQRDRAQVIGALDP
jgi:regulator of cell morphogenesis and NO signaling